VQLALHFCQSSWQKDTAFVMQKKNFSKDSGLEPKKRGRNAIDITSKVCTGSATNPNLNSKIKVYAPKVTKCNNMV
jgi:hypothetical protein